MSIEAIIAETDNWFIGEDKVLEFTVFQADGVTPQNIAGWSLEWVLRKNKSALTEILNKSTGAATITIGGGTGKCQVLITDDDTAALVPGTYYHTLRRNDAGSDTVLSFGEAVLRHGATR